MTTRTIARLNLADYGFTASQHVWSDGGADDKFVIDADTV